MSTIVLFATVYVYVCVRGVLRACVRVPLRSRVRVVCRELSVDRMCTGEFSKGMIHGRGFKRYTNGTQFDGQWVRST